jgi:hypothetical protein
MLPQNLLQRQKLAYAFHEMVFRRLNTFVVCVFEPPNGLALSHAAPVDR